MKLTDQRRELLEFLAVAEGFVHIGDLDFPGMPWVVAMRQVGYLRRAGMIGGLADHIQITDEGREAIGLPRHPVQTEIAFEAQEHA